MFADTIKARKAITDKHGKRKPKAAITDKMLCPVCSIGELRYAISSHNGHIHGHCNTENCVSWME